MSGTLDRIESVGFALVAGVFSPTDAGEIADALSATLQGHDAAAASVRTSKGTVYAARNILDTWPPAREVWKRPDLITLLNAMLGREFGLVRALFFDKPPGRTWSLLWHKDLVIALVDNALPSERFSCRNIKARVPHVEAPVEVLASMLTLRIHLDDVTDENGPLMVIPGSHRAGKAAMADPPPPVTIYARRGDVLAMRPLVSHASGNSVAGTTLHRRVLHLEFAASPVLPDGFTWHTFLANGGD